ncbi:MAG: ABC transporter ATP-binding protein [Patescibacteria group bacterium]
MQYAAMSTSLLVQDLNKSYAGKPIIQNLSFEVPSGCIFGLLGPNGAGKTTLIRMVTAITKPDTGLIKLNNQILSEDQIRKIGYMPEERGLYKKMKVGPHLIYLARLKGLSKMEAEQAVKDYMQKWEILDWYDKKVEELSKGMQQKIQFIATVAHKPDLIILDEPLSGLDPINAELINKEILELKAGGTTIIFSTHRMEQVEEICDSILLINKGQKVLDGKVGEVKQQFKQNQFKVSFEGNLSPVESDSFELISSTTNSAIIKIKDDSKPNQLLSQLSQQVQVYGFNEILPSLNEIFIRQVSSNHSQL